VNFCDPVTLLRIAQLLGVETLLPMMQNLLGISARRFFLATRLEYLSAAQNVCYKGLHNLQPNERFVYSKHNSCLYVSTEILDIVSAIKLLK